MVYFVYVVAKYISKGLFDKKWHREVQDRIDSIKNERVFWNLMSKKFEITYPNIEDIVRGYFGYIADANRGRTFDTKKITEQDVLGKSIINRHNDAIKNVNLLAAELDRRQKLIDELLIKENFTFNMVEIHKEYESFIEKHPFSALDTLLGKKLFETFLYGKTDNNPYETTTTGGIPNNKEVTGNEIFEARKAFESNIIGFEYDESGNDKIDSHKILELKLTQLEMGEFFNELLCKKTKNNREKLKQALENWDRLNMLRWCVSDFATPHLGLNKIQWTMLRIFEGILLF